MSISDWIIAIVGVISIVLGFISGRRYEQEKQEVVNIAMDRRYGDVRRELRELATTQLIVKVNDKAVVCVDFAELHLATIYSGTQVGDEYSLLAPTDWDISNPTYQLSKNPTFVDVLVRRTR